MVPFEGWHSKKNPTLWLNPGRAFQLLGEKQRSPGWQGRWAGFLYLKQGSHLRIENGSRLFVSCQTFPGVTTRIWSEKTTSHKSRLVKYYWVVVSHIFYFHHYLGKWSNLANIVQMGWNHQLDYNLARMNEIPWWKMYFWFQMGRRRNTNSATLNRGVTSKLSRCSTDFVWH